jgi:hypothetical protein
MENKESGRKSYRLEYLAKDMPTVEISSKKHPILDISVSGLKFWNTNGFYIKQSLSGKIYLHVGEPIDFGGTVKRIGNNRAAIEFNKEIPGKVFIAERNYLKNEKKYRV